MTTSTQGPPELSVIVITPDRYATIRKTMGLLAAQTARERLEVLIVAPSDDVLAEAQAHVGDRLRVRVLPVGQVTTVGAANAAGVRAASAPLVAFVEEHSYPEPGWAQAFIAAHQQSWAVVGPVARNANPDSLVSWADFALFYGPWAEGHSAGAVEHLPGHNSSYKRDLLLAYGDELGPLLGAESVLQWDLRAKGYALYLEPAARMAHVNFGLMGPWLTTLFHASRLFAAVRAAHWPWWRKALYVLGAPLIPAVRLVRHCARAAPGGRAATPALAGLAADRARPGVERRRRVAGLYHGGRTRRRAHDPVRVTPAVVHAGGPRPPWLSRSSRSLSPPIDAPLCWPLACRP